MLFFIAALFLFNSTRDLPAETSDYRFLQGITTERLAEIPTDSIQHLTSREANGVTVHDVMLFPEGVNTPASDDLAKQLATTLGTLVTAVAAFYFGANSVSSAHRERTEVPKTTLVVPHGTQVTGAGNLQTTAILPASGGTEGRGANPAPGAS